MAGRWRLRRILGRLAVLAAGLALLALAAAAWRVRRAWPQEEGRLRLAGLAAQVEVIRDAAGVPHIYAAGDRDLLFAQGFVHAQDRLWSMDFDRRLAGGRLSELVGESALRLDRYLRTLGARRTAERDWEALSPETRGLLEAYCAGINAFIASHRGRYPIEYALFRAEPAPWTPTDILVRTRLMSWLLSQNQQLEVLRAAMIAAVGEDKAQQLLPPYDHGAPLIVPAGAGDYAWLRDADVEDQLAARFGGTTFGWGSNQWSVSGRRTASGKPLLANDTHLDMSMPSVWYHIGLHGGSFDVAGASLPGVPFVILGTNGHVAWGATAMMPDVQDFYIEQLDDAEAPRRYLYEGAWHDLEIVRERIALKGGEPVELEVHRTRHGPIMNGVIGRLRDRPEKLALRWSDDEPNRLLDAVAALGRARDWEGFRAALRQWGGPHMNFGYADAAGNIGYQAAGRIPIRAPGHQGLLPVPGSTAAHEWQGFIPFDELPRLYNPANGQVVTANNKVVGDEYPYHLAYEWGDPYRAARIADLLGERDRLTVEDFAAIQLDTHALQAESLVAVLRAVEPADDLERRAMELVAAWDLRHDAGSAGAAIYQVFYRFFFLHTLGDELGEKVGGDYQEYDAIHGPLLAALAQHPDDPWFDDVTTPSAVEQRAQIAERSFRRAVAWLAEHRGGEPESWAWGELHPMISAHRPLGQSGIPPLERLFNGPPVAASGDRFTVNSAWFANDEGRPYAANGGAGQRLIVDLADPDNSRFVQNSGQVEQLFHPHRLDLVPLWQRGGYRPLHFTRRAVTADAAAVLVLEPL